MVPGITQEPVALFDTSELFAAFGGVTRGETGGSDFMAEEGSSEGLGLLNRITGGLVAMICSLATVAMSSLMIEKVANTILLPMRSKISVVPSPGDWWCACV